MTPAPPAARRLPLLGCALIAVAALTLSACGGDSATTAESAAAQQPKRKVEAGTVAAKPCPAKVGAFVKSLDAMRSQLAVGLSYEQYAAKVKSLSGSYNEIPVEHLTIGCLASTGTPSERALNEYIDAANAWGECLADSACTSASIEPVLQRKWRIASHFLSSAQ